MSDPDIRKILNEHGAVLKHHTDILNGQTALLESLAGLATEPIDDGPLLDVLRRIEAALDAQTRALDALFGRLGTVPSNSAC